VPEGALVWFVPAFPPRFLDDGGGIWRRVLAHTVLSRQERVAWESLPANPRRRTDWLMGRIALKEAARRWIAHHHGVLALPADVEIQVGIGGKPHVAANGLALHGALPQVSVAHANGAAVAIAAPPDTPVGIDLEPCGRAVEEAILTGAFTPQEQTLIKSSAGQAPLNLLRAWCAKEAAAKCLGQGLNGRPQAFALSRFASQPASESACVTAAGHEVQVTFAMRNETVLAVAVDKVAD
jgi:phosphopantetheinyl transferase